MKERSGFTVHEGIEARIIMFGFKHDGDELMFSDDVTGKNPFQDVRVRTAAYQSIDVDTLIDKVMRGNAQPAAQLVSDTMNGYSESLSERLAYDPEASKANSTVCLSATTGPSFERITLICICWAGHRVLSM